jgi:hypothetical protein
MLVDVTQDKLSGSKDALPKATKLNREGERSQRGGRFLNVI